MDKSVLGTSIHLVAFLFAVASAGNGRSDDKVSLPGDVVGGWRVFTAKRCIRCHAVWDLGGQIGPDLGRTGQAHITASDLAGTMWNHVPRMHSHMLHHHIAYPSLSLKEMSDLFSFLYFVRHIGEPGDPAIGRRIVREKGCVHCHSTETEVAGSPALNFRRWGTYANPIIWAQKIWEHAPKMEQAMEDQGLTWPQLNDSDLVNITAYVRGLGGREAGIYLRPGSAEVGNRLFSEHRCRSCHVRGGLGGDLATAALPHNLAALASRMWNHSPEMTRLMRTQGVERSSLTPQEMADIIAYLLSLRASHRAGRAERGRLVFVKKGCSQCHLEEPKASSSGPVIAVLARDATPIRFAHAMWNHGVPMLDVMSELGGAWPIFHPGELADLIAYLRTMAGEQIVPETGGASPASVSRKVSVPVPSPGLPPIRPGSPCASNECHPNLLAGRDVHTPVAQGECDACHAIVDAETHQLRLLADTSDLCYRCHDEPLETMQAHGPVSVTVCTACHEPHSSENAYGPSFTGNEMCFANMIGMASALTTLVPHRSAAGQSATTTVSTREQSLSTAPPGLEPLGGTWPAPQQPGPSKRTAAGGCVSTECHAPLLSGALVHVPSAQQQCEACHRLADEQAHRFQLTGKEPDLCYQCHEETQNKGTFLHGPLALGLCTTCHNPHSAPHEGLLPASGSQLCFLCHSEMDAHVGRARVQHEAVTSEKSCLSCHDPHSSDFKYQLHQEQPGLCYQCHEETRDSIEASVVSHEPVASGKKCSNCHNPHGSDVEKILLDTEMNLCLDCHDEPMDTPTGPITDMKSWIADNPERHGPIREGLCTGCHLPHGSSHFRILRHSFPKAFYREFSVDAYALCFACHEEQIVLNARTTTLTAFRNGEKNLHYLHVNQEKGRTCRACHEIHAGTRPKRMKDFVPFGSWKYPVNFETTSDGGRCAPGCHVPRAYSRTREIVEKQGRRGVIGHESTLQETTQ